MALAGDIHAIRELLDRGLGRPHQALSVEQAQPNKPTDAEIIKLMIQLVVPVEKWMPGLRRRYEAGMIEGFPPPTAATPVAGANGRDR
jgi:hypothetical protein